MSITQITMALTLFSIFGLGIMTVISNQKEVQTELNRKTSIMTMRQNLIGTIGNYQAWQQTKARNAIMNCKTPTQALCNRTQTNRRAIALYDATGTLVYDSTQASNGFTTSGLPCNTFNANQGNDSCPLRAVIEWRGACVSAPCTNSEDLVAIQFLYNPSSMKNAINTTNYSLTEQTRTSVTSNQDSPYMTCASKQQIFIGTGQAFAGRQADSQGCVPYATFMGPQGVQGPGGPRGSQGSTGSRGPAGADAVCP